MNYKKGYKAFYKTNIEKQGKCMDFLFEEGKTYKIEGELKLCSNGFHFCKDLVLTFEYYGSDTSVYCFAEVEALGEIQYEQPTKNKCCTSEMKIVRFLSDQEVLDMIDRHSNSGDWNSGNWNSGDWNSGNRNSGYRNSGDWNSGHSNSGNWNSGDRNSGNLNSGHSNSGNSNSGDRNSGDWNSGNWNSGNRNSGYRNSGYRNSGDWNSGNRNSGNRNSGYRNSGDWNSGNRNSGYRNSGELNSGNRNSGDRNSGDWNSGNRNSGDWNSGNWNSGNWNSCNKETGFFNSEQPTSVRVFNKLCSIEDWENAEKPDFIYFELGDLSYKEAFQKSFERATKEDIELLKALPNFDADVFFEISGIRLDDRKVF